MFTKFNTQICLRANKLSFAWGIVGLLFSATALAQRVTTINSKGTKLTTGNLVTSGAAAPTTPTPIKGDIWLDTTDPKNTIPKVWDGTLWKPLDAPEAGLWEYAGTNAQLKTLSDGFTARTDANNVFVNDNGNMGIGTATPRAALDITSTASGVIIPRMDTATRTGVSVAADQNAMMVYDTDTKSFWYYDHTTTSWVEIASGGALADKDNDTKVHVEATADEDVIRFYTGDNTAATSTNYFAMKGRTLETLNTGSSVFIGEGAGARDDLSNNMNVFIGKEAGTANTTGSSNTANGYQALYANTTGYYNTANGLQALYSNTAGSSNTANGMYALYYNTTGYNNTANGYRALYSNTTGTHNTANGMYALYSNTTGYYNTANGLQALYYNTTGSSNTANGVSALLSNTTGYQNTVNGYQALYKNTTGYYNSANGVNALFANTTGHSNTVNGVNALSFNTTGNYNTANGVQALYANNTGSKNVANGYLSLYSNTTGSINVACGPESLYSNTIGNFNTAAGFYSLYSNTTGSSNVAFGTSAGRYSGATGAAPNETGFNNVFIGGGTRASADGVSNENVFGYNAVGEGSNTVRLGNSAITGIYAAVSTITTSDGRRKKNVETIDNALDKITQLRGVGYDWKNKETQREFGFIAQEVEEVFPNLVYTRNDEEGTKSLKYDGLIAPLLEAVKEQQNQIKELKAESDALKARVGALENK